MELRSLVVLKKEPIGREGVEIDDEGGGGVN